MSTRGAICRIYGDSFKGVYHHWDSYPTGLGKRLWELYHNHFERDLGQMLHVLIDEHPAGWSTTIDNAFPNALCFCHGNRHDPPQEINENNATGCGCEYVYVFDEGSHTMSVLSSYHPDGAKMIGMFGAGNPNAMWRVLASFPLDGEMPAILQRQPIL